MIATKAMSLFMLMVINEHTIHFPRKQSQVHSINSIEKVPTIIFGGFEFPRPNVKKKYDIIIVGYFHIPVEVT